MRVAAIQYRPPQCEPELARDELTHWVRDAATRGAKLIVCPEMAVSGYVWDGEADIEAVAEPTRGDTFAALASIAREYGVAVICGYVERDEAAYYNAAFVIDGSGNLVANHRKTLLFDADRTWARPGCGYQAVNVAEHTVVPAICMDLNDDGFLRFVERTKPKLIAFSTTWIDEGADVHAYWRWRLRRYDGWFIAANRWGRERGFGFSGRSAILAPNGKVAATADPAGHAVVLVDTSEARSAYE